LISRREVGVERKGVLLVIDARTGAVEDGRPVREYDVQRRLLDADVVDRTDVERHWLAARVADRLGMPAGLTVLAALRLPRYRAVYCDSELYGILLSALVWLTRRRTAVFFLAHWPTRRAKAVVLGRLGAHRGTAGIFVHASALIDRLTAMGVPPAKLHLLPIAVDTTFWSPRGAQWDGPDYFSSAGVELRDYPTLVSALRGLPDVHARVAASSPYSRHGNTLDGQDAPPNLERVDCDTVGLRDVYETSLFVVVPVVESEIGAGLTTIAEAMSMGKAVITSRAEGQADTLAISGPTSAAHRNARPPEVWCAPPDWPWRIQTSPDPPACTSLPVTLDACATRCATWWTTRWWQRRWAAAAAALRAGPGGGALRGSDRRGDPRRTRSRTPPGPTDDGRRPERDRHGLGRRSVSSAPRLSVVIPAPGAVCHRAVPGRAVSPGAGRRGGGRRRRQRVH
jgi:glycosyltransferase involved in cell wall biosynthesis